MVVCMSVPLGSTANVLISGQSSPWMTLCLRLAVYFKIVEAARLRGKNDPDYRFLFRLRFHLLSLAKAYLLSAEPRKQWPRAKWISTAKNEDRFMGLWDKLWSRISDPVADRWFECTADGMSIFSFVRNTVQWERIKNKVEKMAWLNL